MTTKDIIKNPPSLLLGDGLQKMFGIQTELLGYYTKLEKLPAYPIDINKKDSQALMRDFFYRIIEELGEAFQELTAFYDLLQVNQQEEAIEKLRNYNEELADVHHFIMEVLIYSNITTASIASYYKTNLEALNMENIYLPKNILLTCMQAAKEFNIAEGICFANLDNCYIVPPGEDVMLVGGTKINDQILQAHESSLWGLTLQLTKASNLLQNKAWRQTDTYTEGIQFQAHILEIWGAWLRYIDFLGMDGTDLFGIYWKKAQVNISRIKTKY